MPSVALDLEIHAPIERVWEVVLDVEGYPAQMDSVRWVAIEDETGPELRRVAWSVTLKGSILEWREDERIDHDARVVSFTQVSGDLELFEGRWTVEEREPGAVRVTFDVSFEIGIPLLADMLNPVAQRSLRDNITDMLQGIERQSVGA